MSSPVTLITGANGAVGFPVVLHALKANHTVRAVVRSQAKVDHILSAPSIQALPESVRSRLTFAIVPDLLFSTAYDEALKGVTYAIHVASPIPNKSNFGPDDFDKHMIQPAIQGTMNLLEAAERADVKRVVVTSSVVAVLPLDRSDPDAGEKVYNEKSRTSDPVGPWSTESAAYRASKILSLNAAERWADNDGQGRRIELVHVLPALVIGVNELARTKKEMQQGSNGWAVHQMSSEIPFPVPLAGIVIGVEDIAELHVRGLDDSKVPNGQSLVGAVHGLTGFQWQDGKKIIEEAFPKAVEKGVLHNTAWAATTLPMLFDATETEKLTDMKFESFDKSLLALAGQYLDVVGERRE